MIPHSLHNKEYFWSYDEKYDIISYYFLCFSAALIANISIDKNGYIGFCAKIFISQRDECFYSKVSKLCLKVEHYARSNLKNTSQIWVICDLLPFVSVGQTRPSYLHTRQCLHQSYDKSLMPRSHLNLKLPVTATQDDFHEKVGRRPHNSHIMKPCNCRERATSHLILWKLSAILGWAFTLKVLPQHYFHGVTSMLKF